MAKFHVRYEVPGLAVIPQDLPKDAKVNVHGWGTEVEFKTYASGKSFWFHFPMQVPVKLDGEQANLTHVWLDAAAEPADLTGTLVTRVEARSGGSEKLVKYWELDHVPIGQVTEPFRAQGQVVDKGFVVSVLVTHLDPPGRPMKPQKVVFRSVGAEFDL